MKIKPRGLENIKVWGRRTKSRREDLIEDLSVFRPEAFSIMALSIHVIIGATNDPAQAAATASEVKRHPKFFVFHTRWAEVSLRVGDVVVADSDCFMVVINEWLVCPR